MHVIVIKNMKGTTVAVVDSTENLINFEEIDPNDDERVLDKYPEHRAHLRSIFKDVLGMYNIRVT